jgi:hypothetical protein
MTGKEKRQPRSILVSETIHEALPDDPLPTTRECEKNIRATIHATTEQQTSNKPNRRRDELLINLMPPNFYSTTGGSLIQFGHFVKSKIATRS